MSLVVAQSPLNSLLDLLTCPNEETEKAANEAVIKNFFRSIDLMSFSICLDDLAIQLRP